MRTLLGSPLLAFAALPGVVAYLLPAWLAWRVGGTPNLSVAAAWPGLVPLALGSVALLRCANEFHRRGDGTLAPWAPPKRLVTSGPYSRLRNPMYLAVLLVLAGWALALRSGAHALYALAVAVVFHLRVVLAEEPWQARVFGTDWAAYAARVPRWVPPLRAWPWALWFGTGLLLGAAFWALSPALLGRSEPWDAKAPVWTLSWPLVGTFGAAARHARGLWLPIGFALGQIAAIQPPLWRSEFGALGAVIVGVGMASALGVTLVLLGAMALWRRVKRQPSVNA